MCHNLDTGKDRTAVGRTEGHLSVSFQAPGSTWAPFFTQELSQKFLRLWHHPQGHAPILQSTGFTGSPC